MRAGEARNLGCRPVTNAIRAAPERHPHWRHPFERRPSQLMCTRWPSQYYISLGRADSHCATSLHQCHRRTCQPFASTAERGTPDTASFDSGLSVQQRWNHRLFQQKIGWILAVLFSSHSTRARKR